MQASFWKTVAVVGVIGIGSLALLEAQQRLTAHRAATVGNEAPDSEDLVPTNGDQTVDAQLSDAEFDRLLNGDQLSDPQFEMQEPAVASAETVAAFDVMAEPAMGLLRSEAVPPQDFTPPPNTSVQMAALTSGGNPFEEPAVSSAAYQDTEPSKVTTVGFETPAAEAFSESTFESFAAGPQPAATEAVAAAPEFMEFQPLPERAQPLVPTPQPEAKAYEFFAAGADDAATAAVTARETLTSEAVPTPKTAQFYTDNAADDSAPPAFSVDTPTFGIDAPTPMMPIPERIEPAVNFDSNPFPETPEPRSFTDEVPTPREIPERFSEPARLPQPVAPMPRDDVGTFEGGPALPFAADEDGTTAPDRQLDRVPEIREPGGLLIPGMNGNNPDANDRGNSFQPRSDFAPETTPNERSFPNYNTPADAPVRQYNEPGIPMGNDNLREFNSDRFEEPPRNTPIPEDFRGDLTRPEPMPRADDRGTTEREFDSREFDSREFDSREFDSRELTAPRREQPLSTPRSFDNRDDRQPSIDIRGNGTLRNSAVRPVSGTMRPNLVLEKNAPESASVGVPLEYFIFVRNEGDATAYDVVVEDDVTEAAEIEGAHPQSDFDRSSRKLIWKFDEIVPGQMEKIVVRVRPTGEGVMDGTASVKFKSRVKAMTVVTAPKLRLQMEGPDKVQLGQEVAYRYILTNEGSGEARDVFIRTLLPASGGLKHSQGRDLEYEIQAMKPGEQREIMLAVVAGEPGDHSAKAEVTASGKVAVTAGWRTTVVGAQLQIVRRGPKRRFVNRSATYENIITNETTFEARDAKVVEQIPAGMRYIGSDHGGKYDTNAHTVTWMINRLGAGQSEQLQLELMPMQAGNMESIVTILENVGIQSDDYVSTTVVEDLHNVSATISQMEGPVAIGDDFGFTINIDNRGTAEARDVNLRVRVPKEIQVIAAGSKSVQAGLDPKEPNTVQYNMIVRIEPGQKQAFELKLRGQQQVNNGMVEATVQYEHMNAPLVVSESVTVYDERL